MPSHHRWRVGRAAALGLSSALLLLLLTLLLVGGWLAVSAHAPLHAGAVTPRAAGHTVDPVIALPAVLVATPAPAPAPMGRQLTVVLVTADQQAAVLELARAVTVQLQPLLPPAARFLVAPLPAPDTAATSAALDDLVAIRQRLGLPTTIVTAGTAPGDAP